MSKRELKRWENKYRLWKTLHPNINYPKSVCGKKCVGHDECRKKNMIVLVYSAKRNTIILMTIENIRQTVGNGCSCIEWIKHV